MIINRNSMTVLETNHTLALAYESGETTGRLVIHIVDESTQRSCETKLKLDPWSHAGYVVALWRAASSILIGGADRIVVLSLDRSGVLCSILYELGEYETVDEPNFVMSNDTCLVASESRVICIDRRNAIRWSWSVRRPPLSEWAQLAGRPVVAGGDVRIPIKTRTTDLEIVIDLVDGARS